MALPVTIATTEGPSFRTGHNRPFRSSSGDIYVILSTPSIHASMDVVQDGDFLHIAGQFRPSGTGIAAVAFKAADPTVSFAVVDAANEPSWVSDANDSEVFYSRFNMATDLWEIITGGNEEVIVDDVQNSEGESGCFITQRSDGDLIVVYQGFRDKFMGVDRARVAFASSTDGGATWTADQDLSATGAAEVHLLGPIVIPRNNSDQAHAFYWKDDGSPTLIQRAIDNTDSLRDEHDTGFTVGVNVHTTSAMAFTRGGSDFVKLLYQDADGADPFVYEMTPFSDNSDPTGSDSIDQVSADDVNVFNQAASMDFVFDPSTEIIHVLTSDVTNDDIQHYDDQGSDSWQDNGAIVTGTFERGPSLNIFDRDGAKIGFVYEDSTGDVFYNEIDVTPSTTALSEVDMAQQNLYQGPFGTTGNNKYGIMLAGNDHDLVAVKATTATPVDGDWNSIDSIVRVFTSFSSPGWLYQDPIKSLWVSPSTAFMSSFFDASDAGPNDPGSVWTNDGNVFDGSIISQSSCDTNGSSASNYLEGEGTNSPASGLTISSISVQVIGRRALAATATLGMRITTDGAGETLLDITQAMLGTDLRGYSFDLSTPSGGWTYAKLQALEVRFWREIGSGNLSLTSLSIIVNVAASTPLLYTVYQQESGRIGLSIFDTGSDTWFSRDGIHVGKPGELDFENTPTFHAVAVAIRSSGQIVVVAANEQDDGDQDLKGVHRQTLGGGFEAFGAGAGTDNDIFGVSMMPPASDGRITWVFTNDTDDEVTAGSIPDDGSSATLNQTIDATADTARFLVGPGIIDNDDKIYVPYIDASDQVSVANWASAASISASIDADVSDVNVYGQGRTAFPFAAFCLALQGTTGVHLVYARDSDQDISHDDDVDGGGTTDAEIVDAVTANRISCRVIGTDICLFYDDGGTTKFHCEALAALARKAGRLLLLGVGHGAQR